jgi:pimeloyl-ACP methyl ester carboxylesterase
VPWSLTGSIPGARFAAIDGAAHFPMVEKPEETARLLSEFLD